MPAAFFSSSYLVFTTTSKPVSMRREQRSFRVLSNGMRPKIFVASFLLCILLLLLSFLQQHPKASRFLTSIGMVIRQTNEKMTLAHATSAQCI
ncbi:hypothetical protein C5167_013378 [Papaver somniferum]|uniref:Uncharacterized protein n=1 Tax=Papaver somniferum TaxID=3469 RepID=A0A4Y7J458_PAPSO|nr:hypothetical protein C5167_013378 [Papaver somniferum]